VTLIPPHDPLLGALSMDEVYFDQEGPRFFSATSRSGRRFLAVAVDEDESSDTYLYLPVSDARFGEIRSGALDLRTAFREPEGGSLFVVVADYEQPPRNRVSVVSPERWPRTGFHLRGHGCRCPPRLDQSSMQRHSLWKRRSVDAPCWQSSSIRQTSIGPSIPFGR
jgi:hypothetical protein